MQLNGHGVICWRYPMLGGPKGFPRGKCKNDLKAQNPGTIVSNLDACKVVSHWVFTTKYVIPVVSCI